MSDATRLRATALLTVLFSVPTVRALLAYDIEVTTAAVRVIVGLVVAMAAVAAVATLLARVGVPDAIVPVAEDEPEPEPEVAEVAPAPFVAPVVPTLDDLPAPHPAWTNDAEVVPPAS